MGLTDYFDSHWTTVLGIVLIVLGLVPLTETLFQINIIGGTLSFMQGWLGGLVTIFSGLLLATKGATRAATYVKEIVLGVWG